MRTWMLALAASSMFLSGQANAQICAQNAAIEINRAAGTVGQVVTRLEYWRRGATQAAQTTERHSVDSLLLFLGNTRSNLTHLRDLVQIGYISNERAVHSYVDRNIALPHFLLKNSKEAVEGVMPLMRNSFPINDAREAVAVLDSVLSIIAKCPIHQ